MHRHGLRDVGTFDEVGAVCRLDRIEPRLDLVGRAVRLAGADIEFPSVPRTADDLAPAAVAVTAGDGAVTQASALMRAAIEHPVKIAVEIEDRNRTALDREEFARSWRNLAGRGHDVAAHAFTP